MRISELSRASGVPIPTIKFYLREGLLPRGVPTGPRQAEYSEGHLRRLRLIRVLSEVGGLRLREVGVVLRAIDDQGLSLHEVLGVAHHALGPASPDDEQQLPPYVAEAQAEVDRLLEHLGWRVSAGAPARRSLAEALATLRRMGGEVSAEVFEPYARIADTLAAREVATIVPARSRAEAVEGVVVGTMVFEAALVALRRLAQEHHSALQLSRGPVSDDAGVGEAGVTTSGERPDVHEFLEAYRTAFRRFDAGAIADLFAYPCQITSGDGGIEVRVVPTRQAWLPQLERLVGAYRALGVRSAGPIELRVTELTPRLAEVAVRWRLVDGEGATLYDFDAAYTLADLGQGMRITAIAHNETRHLRALLEGRGR